jgi:hypothetical protein
MTLREVYLERCSAEAPAFLAVLKPLPAESLSYKPHERWSAELADLVAKMDEISWNATARFYCNGKMVSEQPSA